MRRISELQEEKASLLSQLGSEEENINSMLSSRVSNVRKSGKKWLKSGENVTNLNLARDGQASDGDGARQGARAD